MTVSKVFLNRLNTLFIGLSNLPAPVGNAFESGEWDKCLIGHAAKNGIDGWYVYDDGRGERSSKKVRNDDLDIDMNTEDSVRHLYGNDASVRVFLASFDNWQNAMDSLSHFIVSNGGSLTPPVPPPSPISLAEQYARLADMLKDVLAFGEGDKYRVTVHEHNLNGLKVSIDFK